MVQLIIMPMMSQMYGIGFSAKLFSGSKLMATTSLMAHLVFGTVVGFLYNYEKKELLDINHV